MQTVHGAAASRHQLLAVLPPPTRILQLPMQHAPSVHSVSVQHIINEWSALQRHHSLRHQPLQLLLGALPATTPAIKPSSCSASSRAAVSLMCM